MGASKNSTKIVARELILDIARAPACGPHPYENWDDIDSYFPVGPGARLMLHRLENRFPKCPTPGSNDDFQEARYSKEMVEFHRTAQKGLWQQAWDMQKGDRAWAGTAPALPLDTFQTGLCIGHKYTRMRERIETETQGRNTFQLGPAMCLYVNRGCWSAPAYISECSGSLDISDD